MHSAQASSCWEGSCDQVHRAPSLCTSFSLEHGVASLCLGECGCCLSLDLASPRNVMQGLDGLGWLSPAVWTHSLEAVLFVSGITGT